MGNKNKQKTFTLFGSDFGDNLKSSVAILAVAFLLYIFTFYIDGEMGVILIAFMFFSPLVSFFFVMYSRGKPAKGKGNCRENGTLPARHH